MKTNLFKSFLLAVAVLLAAIPLQAQMVSNNNDDEVNKVDQYAPKYRPNQVIIKFKETSPVDIKSNAKGKFQTSSVANIDKLMNEIGVLEAEQLMPLTGAIKNRAPRKAKAISGREVTEPDLSKLYCLKLDSTIVQSVEEVVERLSAIDEVEFAEPNYLAFIQATEESTTYQSEPLFSEQWGLNAINMPQLWAMDKEEETRPVIAILDTGVDITHPDLADNIWTNANEADGASYTDDDANGYVDDVHGWDFIAGTAIIGNGMDRNGHGTHCAGIAAAVGNNDIGITGANPDALILPIKVMNDDGTGDIATICRGIDYATACGAHVLSMSFGTGMPSAAMYQSLCNALTNYAVLVGAAGNSGTDINVYSPLIPSPSFPGAFDVVIGVMASNESGNCAGFSNYDPDGPFFSKYNMDKAFSADVTWNDEAMWNYDVMAPGVGIFSTYLNGSYKSLNGTSMATPMVAGAISRILQVKGYDYARDYGLMGDMAMAKDGELTDLAVFNAYQAAGFNEENRQVSLALTALEIDDSEGDGDGRFDAGETISIWPTIRSLWGHAQNIRISIEPYDENVPTDALEILDNNVDFGWSLNTRGSMKSQNPIRVRVNENANDGLHLPYKIVITSDNLFAAIEQEHVFEVENGIELGSVINEDLTLYPSKHYIVTKSIAIPEGRTLTILPGTRLEISENLRIESQGHIIAKGTAENPIVFTSRNPSIYWGGIIGSYERDTLAFCKIENSRIKQNVVTPYAEDCVIKSFNGDYNSSINAMFYFPLRGQRNNIIDTFGGSYKYSNMNSDNIDVFSNNYINLRTILYGNPSYKGLVSSNVVHSGNAARKNDGYFSFTEIQYMVGRDQGISIDHAEYPSWLGTGKEEIIRPYIYDSMNPNVDIFTTVDLSNMPKRPYAEPHGIVWKVVVDGKDAQDEFDELPPLGVGRHEFKVYFNRPEMDQNSTPKITMGLREPYTQTAIAEDGAWSVDDGVAVYTAYLTITGKTNADGLNRIYVTGAKDNEFFDVPDEKYRFNVLVQAAGSMATGFHAEAGLGMVNLTWDNENNDFEDAMGFNVYRYTMLNDSVAGDTIRLNQTILDIEATEYTDYEVTPGETYYYYYKVLSTDLKEYDISNVVAATPLTSIKGDANGSMSVNVADVVSIVSYLSQQDPQPFIFDAADVNEDGIINILDIVGVINIIAHPNGASVAVADASAVYTIVDGILYVDSPVALGGVQVMVNAPAEAEIRTLEALDEMERNWFRIDENTRMLLSYSMSGKSIPAGKTPLLDLGNAGLLDIVLSDIHGNEVMLVNDAVHTVVNDITVGRTICHPGIYDMMGRKISSQASDLDRLAPGIYIVNGQKVVKK